MRTGGGAVALDAALREPLEATRVALTEALTAPALRDAAAPLAAAKLDAARLGPSDVGRLRDLHDTLAAGRGLPPEQGLERRVLCLLALAALDRLPTLPVDTGVRRLFLEEFRLYAAPDARRAPLLAAHTPTFLAALQTATLVRFPAGQLHWDVSGLERRALLRTPRRDLWRLARFVAFRMRGFGPAFFAHVNGLRKNPFIWLEKESDRSYHRMARALALQPQMLGLVIRAWFHDPDLAATSPHLAWTNRVFLDHGGLVVANGDADRDAGFLENNAGRRAAYERGEYRPQYGVVLWPRAAMLRWAAAHPELDDA